MYIIKVSPTNTETGTHIITVLACIDENPTQNLHYLLSQISPEGLEISGLEGGMTAICDISVNQNDNTANWVFVESVSNVVQSLQGYASIGCKVMLSKNGFEKADTSKQSSSETAVKSREARTLRNSAKAVPSQNNNSVPTAASLSIAKVKALLTEKGISHVSNVEADLRKQLIDEGLAV